MGIQSTPLTSSSQREPTVLIKPTGGWLGFPLRELWQYRELLYFLVWRDLKVRYKQSFLGALWIVLQPLITMVVLTAIFNRVLGIGSDSDIPYPIFVYSALLPWNYFANSLTRTSTSLVKDRNLISKIYFPRLAIPIAGVLPGLVDFVIAFVILLVMMFFYGYMPGTSIIALPLVLLLATLTALGAGLWLSALNVQYRDIQYVAPFLVQIWLYSTPIMYSISRIPEQWRWLYSLNPMVGVVQSFRYVLLNDPTAGNMNWTSLGVTLVLLITGLIYFRRTERIFADVV